jgi:hypothetical protein
LVLTQYQTHLDSGPSKSIVRHKNVQASSVINNPDKRKAALLEGC